MKTDNAYPPDPEIMMTPEDIAELRRIDLEVRQEHEVRKVAQAIKRSKKNDE